MPLRPAPLHRPVFRPFLYYQLPQQQLCAALNRRAFRATAAALFPGDAAVAPTKNHYERLHISHNATPADIKKSFYKLSKVHHPDANPNDPDAAHTFSLLSESYTVLSDPPRRAAYDRDVLRLHHHSHSHHGSGNAQPRGSYHSAGGRPASGLSRRKTTFRGPPPSFYRSGGYGAHADKRRRAHEESTSPGSNTEHQEQQQPNDSSSSTRSAHGGMGPGDDPFGHHDDVPHFDRRGHHRTQKREDERRWQRSHKSKRAVDDEDIEFEPQMSIGAHFMVVIGLLTFSFVVPALYINSRRSKRKRKVREY